jgi:hypothetical protein
MRCPRSISTESCDEAGNKEAEKLSGKPKR